ncbi:SDR family NAD(P)-dependent oxidoreductase [Leifsonia sp. 2TAF2]|uniref:SDR family NAD(P)-dependent oxidoreductase n=1 Tax=Leifsonia sp. 2TAF2 TaxID=3233009 RepID=UPI003F98395D
MSTYEKTILITGANSGIGKDVARQLAERPDYGRIYLASRDMTKGHAALEELRGLTGRDIFTVVPLDLRDLESVQRLTDQLPGPLNGVVLNAGGFGGPTPAALAPTGVTEMFAQNVLGHVVLLETLLSRGAVTDVAVLTGSEAALGSPRIGIAKPTFGDHSVDEFTSVIDGSWFSDRKYKVSLAYGQAKYLGALWMASLARQHPGLRLLTMSPGGTANTEGARDMGFLAKTFMNKVFYPVLAPTFGFAHPLPVGAARLVKAVSDPTLTSGAFYASAEGKLVGKIVDQGEFEPSLRDPLIQDHASEAIHTFVPQKYRVGTHEGSA